MHVSLILDEPEHQIPFLKGSSFNLAAMITMQILLVNRRASRCKVTLYIQEVKSILTCFFTISFNISRHTGLVVTDVIRENRLYSVNHEERRVSCRSVGGSIDSP